MTAAITAADVRRYLSYDASTGVLTWIAGRRRGRPAGYLTVNGYIHVGLCRRLYLGHRLAWLYVHGEWPPAQIDHVDGDRANNRLSNLRLALPRQNSWNYRKPITNKSGMKGACENRPGRWIAQIKANGKKYYLGTFDSAAAAHAAYCEAAARFHGEYARTE